MINKNVFLGDINQVFSASFWRLQSVLRTGTLTLRAGTLVHPEEFFENKL